MQRGGWQSAGNPNMAPLPSRPGIGAGAGFGAPPGMMMNRPMHVGPAAGGVGMPAINPGWAQRAAEIGRAGTEVATTLFVGSISPGVGDDWLKQLLSACGPLTSLKRVNATFGFATFMDADGVLRALETLNGLELPAMGPNAEAGQAKALVVKADEKTKKFLAEFEKGRVVGETERAAADVTSGSVASILARMRDPASQTGPDASISSLNVPSHLKDLPPEDLPEEHRGSVLSEIDKFRQASAAREEEKRRRERVMEIERRQGNGWGPNAGNGGEAGANGAQGQQGMGAHGAQSYQKPVNFVASTQPSADPVARDEEEEKRRKEHALETEKRSAAEAERRYIAAERRRFEHWEHEDKKEKTETEERVQRASAFITRVQSWDEEQEREREMFYADRARWKHYRAPVRQREEEADEADRRAEAAEIENAKTAAQRAAEQAAAAQIAHAEAQRAAGVLLPGAGVHAPLRLKVAPPEAAPKEVPVPAPRGGVLGEADEEVGASKKKLRKIELGDGLSEAQREELRKAHAVKVEQQLPREREALFNVTPAWDWVDETTVVRTYRPFIDVLIADSVGEAVPELAEAFLDALRKRAKPATLVQVLEPVLDDEAALCVEKFWRRILVDTLSLAAAAAARDAT